MNHEMAKDMLAAKQELDIINAQLASLLPVERVEWSLQNLPRNHALSSSFGIQSAVMLHMVTQVMPDIPVIMVDTGYLFPETYQFVEKLTNRLSLNLQIAQPNQSSAWFESQHGRLWEQGLSGLQQYNELRKLSPMRAQLEQLQIQTWFSGIRRQQSTTRAKITHATIKDGRYKVHPIAEWTNREVHHYLKTHHLPYHPLWDAGYVSVGDTHSTVPLSANMLEEETRFNGVQRECGLHTA